MILDEIVSIKKVGIRKTIDIEVDGDHLFYCNGILTHNSAAGDANDISEENIQGGISKIQSADNVLGFIPNNEARQTGHLKAKLLKTRDSGGVGKYLTFLTDWQTLTFEPMEKEITSMDGKTDDYKKLSSGGTKLSSEKPNLKKQPGKIETSKTEDKEDGKSSGSGIGGIVGGLGKKSESGSKIKKKVKLI